MEEKNLQNPLKVREKELKPLRRDGGYKSLIVPLHKNLKYFAPGADEDPKMMFLEEDYFDEQKEELKVMLGMFIDLLENSNGAEDLQDKARERQEEIKNLRLQNLKKIVDRARPLEKSYRQLDLFYKNAGPNEVKNITILNVDSEMVKDSDLESITTEVNAILSEPHLALDQDKVYSFLVIPEFLGEKLIQTYADISHENKVLFLTDYKDLKSVEQVMEYRATPQGEKIGGVQDYWRHTAVFANYLQLREKYGELGEKEGIYGSPCIPVAGKLYVTKISQPAAGVEFGEIKNSMGLRFKVNQPQVTEFSNVGLNPLVNAFQQNMPFEATTLFSGANPELQHYAVVRTFSYIEKTLKHFLNQNIHAVLDKQKANSIHRQLVYFLEDMAKYKMIDKGSITRFQRDARRPDKIHLEFDIIPLWATRTIVYKVKAARDEDLEMSREE